MAVVSINDKELRIIAQDCAFKKDELENFAEHLLGSRSSAISFLAKYDLREDKLQQQTRELIEYWLNTASESDDPTRKRADLKKALYAASRATVIVAHQAYLDAGPPEAPSEELAIAGVAVRSSGTNELSHGTAVSSREVSMDKKHFPLKTAERTDSLPTEQPSDKQSHAATADFHSRPLDERLRLQEMQTVQLQGTLTLNISGTVPTHPVDGGGMMHPSQPKPLGLDPGSPSGDDDWQQQKDELKKKAEMLQSTVWGCRKQISSYLREHPTYVPELQEELQKLRTENEDLKRQVAEQEARSERSEQREASVVAENLKKQEIIQLLKQQVATLCHEKQILEQQVDILHRDKQILEKHCAEQSDKVTQLQQSLASQDKKLDEILSKLTVDDRSQQETNRYVTNKRTKRTAKSDSLVLPANRQIEPSFAQTDGQRQKERACSMPLADYV